MITDDQLRRLSEMIMDGMRKEFADKHMSGNLVNTIEITYGAGKVTIDIPAPLYNMKAFQERGVVVKTYKGSYADKLDETGSEFYIYRNGKRLIRAKPHNHIGFVDRVIGGALEEWESKNQLKEMQRKEDNGE